MMSQAQQHQQEKADKLAVEITGCLERSKALETENQQLKQMLSNLVNRFSLLGMAFTGNQMANSARVGNDWTGGTTASPPTSDTTASGGSVTSASRVSSLDLFPPCTPVASRTNCSDPFATQLQHSTNCSDIFSMLPE